MGKGVDLEPLGVDDDGWTMFRTSLGHTVRMRPRPAGGYDIRYPQDVYELKEMYDVESTGEIVIDLVPRQPDKDSLKQGLDPRAYDFAKLDAETGPLWRTWECPTHKGFNDIVAVMLPLQEPNKVRLRCGCMRPYNEAARKLW